MGRGWKHNCTLHCYSAAAAPGSGEGGACGRGEGGGWKNRFGGATKQVRGWKQPVAGVGKTGFLSGEVVEKTVRTKGPPR